MNGWSRSLRQTMRPTMRQIGAALERCNRIRPEVEAHVTPDRMRRYLRALSETPAPSGAAAIMRAPVLRELLKEDGAFASALGMEDDFRGTGTVTLSTGQRAHKPLWYVAHLDTISYLVHPGVEGRHALVPYCYHLTETGRRDAKAMRYDLDRAGFVTVAEGELVSEAGQPYFEAAGADTLRPGDRVVPVVHFHEDRSGHMTGHFDNAGGVAALAVAAPVLAATGAECLLALPDEEEGPAATGNQSMSRGTARLVAATAAPQLAVVVDMQQTAAEGNSGPDGAGEPGQGAVLSEFSSLARGAVTPPHLYAAARAFLTSLSGFGAEVRESANLYTSRSDDVSLMMRDAAIVLLGFPGGNRHLDRALPSAHLDDLVSLSRALVYMSALAAEVRGDAE